MALVEGCKHALEIEVPATVIEEETAKVSGEFQKRARVPGFRPGKAPVTLIRKQFSSDIRQQVIENLMPVYFDRQVKEDSLRVVGQPKIIDVHFHDGEPLKFKAEFEVFPEIPLGTYKGVQVEYKEPEVSDGDIDARVEQIRESKASYVNVDPRPLTDGDFAVVAIESIEGVQPPVKSEDLQLEVGGADTMEAFSNALRGASPGDEMDVEVQYPEDYGQSNLAGKSVKFHLTVNGIRRKELPELNDEFAKDLGDFRDLGEVREAIRRNIFTERQQRAREEAKGKLVDALVAAHDFCVPEAFIERQTDNLIEQNLRSLASQGIDPSTLQIDWSRAREAQRERAIREVKASLLLSAVAERESIAPTDEEVDQQLEQIARERREPVTVVKAKFEKDGTTERIRSHIQTEKTLNLLFESAEKTIPAETAGE